MSASHGVPADRLMADAFGRPRDPRSEEYKQGVRAALAFRIEHKPVSRPYTSRDNAG
ncbi:MAG: hypothetical protein M0T84_14870 [Betaproteobacteria bacterium]|nr:hypothetical protein [Betaproteobacteria bacterium]